MRRGTASAGGCLFRRGEGATLHARSQWFTGVSWERAPDDWSCGVRCSLKAAWDQAGAGRSWGAARPAMLAVQTPARSGQWIRQVAPTVRVAPWPGGERRDRVVHRVLGHWAGMAGAWAYPEGRTTEAGTSRPNAALPGLRDPGRVPPTGRSLPLARRLPPGAQQPVPAGWRPRMATLNTTRIETHPAPYPRHDPMNGYLAMGHRPGSVDKSRPIQAKLTATTSTAPEIQPCGAHPRRSTHD